MSTVKDAIAEAVRRTVDKEARRNEMRVGTVRVAAYTSVVLLDVALTVLDLRPASNLVPSSISALLALAVYALLRFSVYRHAYRFLMPTLDAVLIYELLVHRGATGPSMTSGLAAAAAVACGLFAATGGIRFDRKAGLWTTALAAALFVALVGRHLSGVSWIYGLLAIAAIGLLNLWLADLVRRSMEASRGQVLLGRFLPRAVLESAFHDPLALLAEPRTLDATILFTDLRGFTALSETLPPARVMELLSRVQGALAEEVHQAGGVVDKFIGDGMLAAFGVPEPAADHARQALSAARGVRRAMARLQAEEGGASLKLGMGLHSGSVVAGCIGNGDRLEFTVIGDTVNTASRLESMTKERGVDVLISEETARRAGDHELTDLGEVPIRGRQRALRVYTLPNEG